MGGLSASARVPVRAAVIRGARAVPVTVEVGVSGGIPGLTIVGMPDAAVLEARSRIRCAIRACGFSMPRLHVTVNLAPSGIRKSGTGLDLPIAAAILLATGQVGAGVAEGRLLVGELALDGSVRAVRGMVAYALLARDQGLALSASPSPEAALVEASCAPVSSLSDLLAPPRVAAPSVPAPAPRAASGPDFSDVMGQELAKEAMVVAVTGRHGVLMVGPPGSGKTMLARRLPTIMPPLGRDAMVEAMLVHSVAGLSLDALARGEPPFRAPHHSVSVAGLVGGGHPVLPGEISLAHRGVLFLDEFPEFASNALQALRQPVEEGVVRLVRADGTYEFPCAFLLVAAANPCPCGRHGDGTGACRCSPAAVERYAARMRGPLVDRIDIRLSVARPSGGVIVAGRAGASSAEMAERVMAGREFARWRASHAVRGGGSGEVGGGLDDRARAFLVRAAKTLGLGGRGLARTARVARTIADLREHELAREGDVSEALAFRTQLDA